MGEARGGIEGLPRELIAIIAGYLEEDATGLAVLSASSELGLGMALSTIITGRLSWNDLIAVRGVPHLPALVRNAVEDQIGTDADGDEARMVQDIPPGNGVHQYNNVMALGDNAVNPANRKVIVNGITLATLGTVPGINILFEVYNSTVTTVTGGRVDVNAGSTVTTVTGGLVHVNADGMVTTVTNGQVAVTAGGTVTGVTGGLVAVNAGGTVTTVTDGLVVVYPGGTITTITGGIVTVSVGGTVTTVTGGRVAVNAGGRVTTVTGGTVAVTSGGTVTGVTGGEVYVNAGGTVTGVTGGTVTVINGGLIVLGEGVQLSDEETERLGRGEDLHSGNLYIINFADKDVRIVDADEETQLYPPLDIEPPPKRTRVE